MIPEYWRGCALAALFLLPACTDGGVEQPPPEGFMSVAARLAAPPAEAVDIVVANVPPGRRIEQLTLIDTEGARHPAETLVPVSVAESSATTGPFFGIGASGGSSSGIRPQLTLGWNITRSGSDRTSRRVEARVAIPDPAAYLATSKSWRVEVGFTGIDGKTRTLTFPARAP